MSATFDASGDAGSKDVRSEDGASDVAGSNDASTASSSAASSSGGGDGEGPHSALLAGIAKLKEEQKALRNERKRVAKELKNAEKKRSRLKAKAKQLTDEDLLQVLHLRAAAKAEAGKASLAPPPS